jgi:hypothetical protein
VAPTPDPLTPLTKKQRFKDPQHFMCHSPDGIRDRSKEERDPVRKHTEYFRIEKRLGDLGSLAVN